MKLKTQTSLLREKTIPKRSSCAFCGDDIEWGICEGKWVALEKNLMGFHHCLESLVPRFKEKGQ